MSAGTKPGYAKGLRREQRIPGCKAVTVLGRDGYGNPFSQNTFTVEISARGVRLQGLPPLRVGSLVHLEAGKECAAYRVVWIGEKGGQFEGQVGLECVDPGKGIFGIAPPQSGFFYDDYKRIEAQLHSTQVRYQTLFDNSLGLICLHDTTGGLLSINPTAAQALGYDHESVKGRNIADFLAPSVRSQFPAYLQRLERYGQDAGYMLVVARNRTKHVWLYRNLLMSGDDNPPYVIGHAMDITEQKKTEYQLESALKQLRQAVKEVKTLRGLLPICSWCKKIRTETGDWTELESYISAHSEADFSHGICPCCATKLKSEAGLNR